MTRGLFITLEGPDGCGKSTQADNLRSILEAQGFPCWITREPGGTALGEKIREILLGHTHSSMSPRAEMLLYAASRAQHVDEAILPRLRQGISVISDRFIDSSLIYQGLGLGLDVNEVWQVNIIATGGLLPDLTVVLDLDAQSASERLEKKLSDLKAGKDRIESRDGDFHSRVSTGYNRLKEMFPERVVSVDATLSPEATTAIILSRITDLLEHVRKEGEL